ncbi:MAG: hypothetical protein WA666_07725 [Nitrospirota bacterium]
MRKYLSLLVAFSFILTIGAALSAGASESGTSPKTVSMVGYLIDRACAIPNKDNLDSYVLTHPKECALAPNCMASGYMLYSEGKLYSLDEETNKKVIKFLKKPKSKLHVKAQAIHGEGDNLKITSLSNAE